MASAIACDPPRAAGQPATWPDARSMSPGADVSGPAEREERVRGGAGEEPAPPRPWRRRGRRRWPGGAPAARTPPSVRGWRGTRTQRGEHRPGRARPSGGRSSRRGGPTPAPSTPRPATVSSSERWSTPARPSSSGWTSGDLGLDQLEPVALEVRRREERRDAPPAGGWPSRRRGGTRAASAPRCGLPRRWCRRASSTSTERPASATVIAAASPLGPAPTTTTSGTPSA